ncbi:MAG: hypothetical protein ACTJLL_01260 [Anaplasma sp.]
MKKAIRWLLYVVGSLAVFGILLRTAFTAITPSSIGIEDVSTGKPYSITTVDDGSPAAYKLGALVFRPLIEERLDRYIKEQGLEEHLRDVAFRMPPKETFHSIDLEQGEGPAALCGQKISATVSYFPTDGYKDEDAVNPSKIMERVRLGIKPMNFKLGSHKVRELNHAMIGMRKGGSRVINVTAGENIGGHYVQLLSIDDEVAESQAMENLITFDQKNPSDGVRPVTVTHCGDKVSITYSIRDVRGKVLQKEKSVDFVVGDRQVPIVLEFSALGLRSDSIRSIIVPQELLSDFGKNVKGNDAVVVDVHVTRSAPPLPPQT